MEAKLKYQPPGVHFAVFFGLAAGMFIVNMIMTQVFFGDLLKIISTQKDISPEMVPQFKWMQFIGAILTFVVPPVAYGYLASERPWNHLGLKEKAHIQYALIAFLLLISVQPLAMLLGQLNEKANFGAMNELVKNTEAFYEKINAQFLVMNGPGDLVINMVVVALLPAIAEELFFRGCVQNILERWTKSAVVSIGLASLGFALLHGTFLKFLPILLLGVVLGTIFYVTRNLWYCIIFHFLNNAMALLATYYAQRNEFMKKLAEDEVELNWWFGLASLAVTVALFMYLRKRIPYQTPDGAPAHVPLHDDLLNTPR